MSITKIEWADRVWNPVTGCTKVSAGCANCYAERMINRFGPKIHSGDVSRNSPMFEIREPFTKVICHHNRLGQPLRWRKPSRVFVNSMSDLFHPDVPDEFIDQVFGTVARCPQHIFLVLTKRPAEMKDYWGWSNKSINRRGNIQNTMDLGPGRVKPRRALTWPLPNLWLGVSIEDQATADERIPLLLQAPAAVRFVSCEPLLGQTDLEWYLKAKTTQHLCLSVDGALKNRSFFGLQDDDGREMGEAEAEEMLKLYQHQGIKYVRSSKCDDFDPMSGCRGHRRPGLDWVIAGGESGPGARPMHPDWVRGLRDQCQDAGVPFFFKQWGAWAPTDDRDTHGTNLNIARVMPDGMACQGRGGFTPMERVGKKAAGNTLDGRSHLEFPGGQS